MLSSSQIFGSLREIASTRFVVIESDSMRLQSIHNGASVFVSLQVTRTTSSSVITTSRRPTMTIPNIRPRERRPIHPGEMLREEFVPQYELTVASLADAAGVTRQSINELLRERRAVSPEMALRLGKLFGMSADFWLNLQRDVDLWDAAQELRREISRIKPLRIAS